MSTIIDALKKTQSAIDKKPYSDHTLYGDIEMPNSGRQGDKSHASLLGQKKTPGSSTPKFNNPFSSLSFNFSNPFSFSSRRFKKSLFSLKRQHVIGSTIILCLCGGIWLGYRYDQQITHEIGNVANSIKKHVPTTMPKITTVAALKELTLNGTVHTGSKRDAMINNHLYRVGDTVNGYRILEIHYDQVKLLDPESQKTIVLTTELS